MVEFVNNQDLLQLQQQEPELCILDVRRWEEYRALGYIPGATLIPYEEISLRLGELSPQHPIAVICEHGVRSLHVASYLSSNGFARVYNHEHGMSMWDGKREYPQPSQTSVPESSL